MENYSYIRYRNGFLFFTKQISETEEEITMKDFDPYVMEDIFDSICYTNNKYSLKENDLLTGANIVGFEKIMHAMLLQGI